MVAKTPYPTSSSFPTTKSSRQKLIFSLFLFSVIVFLFTTTIQPQYRSIDVGRPLYQPPIQLSQAPDHHPKWFKHVTSQLTITQQPMKIALVNIDDSAEEYRHLFYGSLYPETVTVHFDEVSPSLTWKDFFPEWIHEDRPKCPRIPMPEFEKYKGLDVVVARLPCGYKAKSGKGIRDLVRLQLNLVVANLVVKSGGGGGGNGVYVVFIGGCEPMWEIFRCDDMVMHDHDDQVGEYWMYKPNLVKLKEKVIMPIGTCELALSTDESLIPGNKQQLETEKYAAPLEAANPIIHNPKKEAYVTVIHSSELYVCGAIALAQSILKTNTTKDLLLLADHTISPKSIRGLKSAGWKIKRIARIRSPNAKTDAYNEWNYSKLRVWQLTEYSKIMFIDSDFIVLHNIDHFFAYPQLSAAANDKWLFNSGIMILEPSNCVFERLMNKRYDLKSYNGGDQGYLNEVFTWWHRLTIKINYLKIYKVKKDRREVPDDRHTIHFLGLKPWVCYKDYDCNWDKFDHWIFASDDAHKKWWEVYDGMNKGLKEYCRLTVKMDGRIRKWRGKAKNAGFTDGHWKIRVKDPRQYRLTSSS